MQTSPKIVFKKKVVSRPTSSTTNQVDAKEVKYYRPIYTCDICGRETTHVRSFKSGLLSQEYKLCNECYYWKKRNWIIASIIIIGGLCSLWLLTKYLSI